MHDELEIIEAWIGRPLPEPYRAFLANTPVESAGQVVLLYGLSAFIERNETYETKEYCPGFVTIGDDSGGSQLLLSLGDGKILIVDAGAMTTDCARAVANDFASWLTSGCPLPGG